MFVHNFAQHLYVSLRDNLFAAGFSIEVYSGTIPVDLDTYETDLSGNAAFYDAQKLATFTGLSITDGNGHLYIKPAATTGLAVGTATWHVVWSSTGPGTYKLMSDVSVAGGTGLLQLDNTAIAAGSPVNLIDFTIDAQELA